MGLNKITREQADAVRIIARMVGGRAVLDALAEEVAMQAVFTGGKEGWKDDLVAFSKRIAAAADGAIVLPTQEGEAPVGPTPRLDDGPDAIAFSRLLRDETNVPAILEAAASRMNTLAQIEDAHDQVAAAHYDACYALILTAARTMRLPKVPA